MTPKLPEIIKRVGEIEQRNEEKDQQALDDRTITVKEVYERVIQVETKLDMNLRDNRLSAHRFTWYVLLLIFLLAINITLSYLGLRGW